MVVRTFRHNLSIPSSRFKQSKNKQTTFYAA